jgi:hypothetical protein
VTRLVSTVTMPPEGHRLPTVLGPLQGPGNKTFTVVVRPTMSVELGCLGKAKDLATGKGHRGAAGYRAGHRSRR